MSQQFGFRSSPASQLLSAGTSPPRTSAIVGSSAGPTLNTTAVTSSVPLGARSVSPSSASSGPPHGSSGQTLRCCDTGRPLFTDPLTGQSVCSCQYDILSYQRLASGVGAGGLPALSMYSAPYSEGMAAYFPALGADQAPFYTSSAAGLELKENLAAGAGSWPYPAVYHPYDAAFAGYPFNGYGMDLNGARRKNATRETTSTLKAWLNEHKKNPYPTKGEKIMLAIITKMTLTQVSTWFANARRRLKKENKMTWEPRNRVEDEDNNNDDESGRKSADNAKDPDSKDSGTGSSEDGDRPAHHRLELLDRPCGVGMDTGSEWSESRPDSGPDSPECLFERPQHLIHPAYHLHHPHTRLLGPNPSSASSPPPPSAAAGGGTTPSKPRIWSLADMASKESDVHHMSPPVTTSAFYSGKLISPLANRGMQPFHPHPGSYGRPHPDFYRSFYGSHLAGGSGAPGEASLLETYTRTFGAGGHNGSVGAGGMTPLSSVLSKAAVVAAAAAAASSPPFTINGGASVTVAAPGASSSSSSGSSVHEHLHTVSGAKLSPVEGKHQTALNKA